jgi:pimeloyl-ACP methyl ester carboxylesterase
MMNTFHSFDGTRIAYHDAGTGPAVVLLHGYGLDALGNWGPFDHSRPLLEKNLAMFKQEFGVAPPMPDPPAAGRPGLIRRLRDAGARVVTPDLRGFGASDKPHDAAAYADSAMARDVVALVRHLRLDAVGVVGFSMGALTGAKLLALDVPEVKSAVLAGISEYMLEGSILEFPKSFPVPDHLPRPLTNKAWAEEGARILEGGRVVPGHLASAHVVAARATGLDPKALAAVLRGAIAEGVSGEALRKSRVPVLLLNGKADVANQKVGALLDLIPQARSAACEGDHYSTPFQPTFQEAVVDFFQAKWQPGAGARSHRKEPKVVK